MLVNYFRSKLSAFRAVIIAELQPAAITCPFLQLRLINLLPIQHDLNHGRPINTLTQKVISGCWEQTVNYHRVSEHSTRACHSDSPEETLNPFESKRNFNFPWMNGNELKKGTDTAIRTNTAQVFYVKSYLPICKYVFIFIFVSVGCFMHRLNACG